MNKLPLSDDQRIAVLQIRPALAFRVAVLAEFQTMLEDADIRPEVASYAMQAWIDQLVEVEFEQRNAPKVMVSEQPTERVPRWTWPWQRGKH